VKSPALLHAAPSGTSRAKLYLSSQPTSLAQFSHTKLSFESSCHVRGHSTLAPLSSRLPSSCTHFHASPNPYRFNNLLQTDSNHRQNWHCNALTSAPHSSSRSPADHRNPPHSHHLALWELAMEAEQYLESTVPLLVLQVSYCA
jgi:hypothetical protein